MEIGELKKIIEVMNKWKDMRIATTERILEECLREDNSCNRIRARGAMKELYDDLKEYANLLMAISLTGIDPSTNLDDIKAGRNRIDTDDLMWGDNDGG